MIGHLESIVKRVATFTLFTLFFCKLAVGAGIDFDQTFPTSVSVCSVTQKRSAITGEAEAEWGHLTMFIRGACRDRSAKYPRLRVCQRGDKDGTILSTNSLFKNVNWIAVEGSDMAFYGGLKPGKLLNQSYYDSTVDFTVEDGTFSGAVLHDNLYNGQDAIEKFIAKKSIDIDFALSFGRDTYCTKLPINGTILSHLINYLNEKNEYYFNGGGTYQWDSVYNNCAHLVHNALASIGVWEPKLVDQPIHVQAFNLAVPANEVLELMDIGQVSQLPRPKDIYGNIKLRDSLADWGWIPIRHGILNQTILRHEPNDLYSGNLKIFVLDLPFGGKEERFKKYTTDSRYSDLRDNLSRFNEIYKKAIVELESETVEASKTRTTKKSYLQFLADYRKYLLIQMREVTEALSADSL